MKLKRHPMKSKLVSSDEAIEAAGQHTKPCGDCPFAREALRGWLGGRTVREWLGWAHSDTLIDCHTARGAQCAGAAIYRRNVCKRTDAPLLTLPKDEERVFSTPMQFEAHHGSIALPKVKV